MGVYQSLADRPRVTNGLTALVIAVAAAFVAYDVRQTRAPAAAWQTYFTTDDGVTYFADDAARLPPFDAHGTPAVRAYVYACGGPPFVAYLERYTPQGLAALARPEPGGKIPLDRDFVLAESCEVKRPGDAAWVRRATDAGRAIVERVDCPGKPDGPPRLVLPSD